MCRNSRSDSHAAVRCRSSELRRATGRPDLPQTTLRQSALCRFFPSLHLQADWSYMSRMADLCVIEGSNAHECAGSDRHIVTALHLQAAHDLQRPTPGSPPPDAADVGAIARKLTRDDDARDDRPFGNVPIELGRIWHRLLLGHVPA